METDYAGRWEVELAQHAWWFMDQGVTTAITITDEHGGMFRVTTGIAKNIPQSNDAYRMLMDYCDQLHYGRIFLVRNDDRAVLAALMQEIIPMQLLTWDFRPAMEYALSLVRTVTLQAAMLAPDVLRRLGGEPWGHGGNIPYVC